MARDYYSNSANVAQLASGVDGSSATTTLTVNSLTGWPATPCWAEIDKGLSNAEVVKVTNISGNVLTVVRGADGLATTDHGAGAAVEHVAPAYVFNRTEAHVDASANVHGIASTASVVGTSGEQTVQDKFFRGAHRAVFSDALPAVVGSAAYESVADTGAARDGYVHRATGADVDRRAFLGQQSGTDRIQLFNDGTVDLNPAASVRPGLRSRGTTQLDGAVTATAGLTVGTTASIGGNVTVGGTLNATGAATLQGGVTSTNATLSGTLSAAGAATLTAIAATSVTASGVVSSLGKPVMLSVAALAAVTSPVADQWVYLTSDGFWYRYTGSAWEADKRPRGWIGDSYASGSPGSITTGTLHDSIVNRQLYLNRKYRLSGSLSYSMLASPPFPTFALAVQSGSAITYAGATTLRSIGIESSGAGRFAHFDTIFTVASSGAYSVGMTTNPNGGTATVSNRQLVLEDIGGV